MKTRAIIYALGLPLACQAQDFGGSLYYDFETKDFSPVISTKLADLPNFLGRKSLTPQLRAFIGVSNARTIGGTALVFSGPLATNTTWDFGIGARSMAGRKISLGLFAGITVKF